MEKKGSWFDDCTGKSKSRLKLDLKKKINDALWFAETYGLFPRNVICETSKGKQIEVQVSDIKTKGTLYSALTDIEKDKLRQIVYICDKFFVSDSAYHEFSSICSTMPSISQVKDCRTEFISHP